MTEQEKRRRRREMERRMRSRETARRTEERGGVFAFRVYVSAVLVGGCLLISLFDSASSEQVCQTIRQSISAQLSAEQVQNWWAKAEAYLQQQAFSLPVWIGDSQEQQETQEEGQIYPPDTERSP